MAILIPTALLVFLLGLWLSPAAHALGSVVTAPPAVTADVTVAPPAETAVTVPQVMVQSSASENSIYVVIAENTTSSSPTAPTSITDTTSGSFSLVDSTTITANGGTTAALYVYGETLATPSSSGTEDSVTITFPTAENVLVDVLSVSNTAGLDVLSNPPATVSESVATVSVVPTFAEDLILEATMSTADVSTTGSTGSANGFVEEPAGNGPMMSLAVASAPYQSTSQTTLAEYFATSSGLASIGVALAPLGANVGATNTQSIPWYLTVMIYVLFVLALLIVVIGTGLLVFVHRLPTGLVGIVGYILSIFLVVAFLVFGVVKL